MYEKSRSHSDQVHSASSDPRRTLAEKDRRTIVALWHEARRNLIGEHHVAFEHVKTLGLNSDKN
jgi:hypothetical protein